MKYESELIALAQTIRKKFDQSTIHRRITPCAIPLFDIITRNSSGIENKQHK